MKHKIHKDTVNQILVRHSTEQINMHYLPFDSVDEWHRIFYNVIQKAFNDMDFPVSQLEECRYEKGFVIMAQAHHEMVGAGIVEVGKGLNYLSIDHLSSVENLKAINDTQSILHILFAIPKYTYRHEREIKHIGASLYMCAKDLTKHMGCTSMMLASLTQAKGFYKKQKAKMISSNKFEHYNNYELEAIGTINANILKYMIKNKIYSFDKFVDSVNKYKIDKNIFLQGQTNHSPALLKQMLTHIQKDKLDLLNINKISLEEIVSKLKGKTLDTREFTYTLTEYQKFIALYIDINSDVDNKYKRHKIPFGSDRQIRNMYKGKLLSINYKINPYIGLKNSIAKRLTKEQIALQCKIMQATQACYANNQLMER